MKVWPKDFSKKMEGRNEILYIRKHISIMPVLQSAIMIATPPASNLHSEVPHNITEIKDELATSDLYWNSKPCTVEAVLGGFGQLTDVDLDASEKFLKKLGFQSLAEDSNKIALDNGAGIGRVISDLFVSRKLFTRIDATEPCLQFAMELKKIPQVGTVFSCKLQDLALPLQKYSLIWNQWVLMYLSDSDLVDFFCRCKAGLAPGGFLCLKENVITQPGGRAQRDEEDNSVTRFASTNLRA